MQQLCDHVVILDRGEVKLDADCAQLNDPEEITLRLTVGAADECIVQRIKQLDSVHRVTVQPISRQGQTSVLVTFRRESEPERRVFSLFSSLAVPILHLSRVEDTLEQVFLNAISQ